jgi:hypothetical protein
MFVLKILTGSRFTPLPGVVFAYSIEPEWSMSAFGWTTIAPKTCEMRACSATKKSCTAMVGRPPPSMVEAAAKLGSAQIDRMVPARSGELQ